MQLIELDENAPDRLIGAGCTLDAAEMRIRVREWAELRDRATGVRAVAGGVAIGLASDEPLDRVADLAARESECCAFYTFLVGKTPAELEAEGPLAYRMYDLTLRGGGLSLVMVGALMTAILVFAFRPGQRWAWWTMWLFPAWGISVSVAGLVIGVAPGQAPPPPLLSGFVLGLLAAAILLVSAPRFFGDRAAA